eukprot:TRINITY_DN6146_c0_g1_i5.p1 TRINITY_DN6146_c0_g1~~TRINITY_DN6146_c0_g1_i5.p1  ORF type:complete len:265 (+),score=66.10 TRINITY_DN6146_c0_g1_i5:225-1019(+)
MPPKARSIYERQNKDFIKEQQTLRKEVKLQQEAEKAKGEKRVERMKAKYNTTGRKPAAAAVAASPPAMPPKHSQQRHGGEVIEVFVRETEPEFSHHYTIEEGMAPPPPRQAQAAPTSTPPSTHTTMSSSRTQNTSSPNLHSCGSAAGMAGAARKKPAGHIPAYLKQRRQELEDEKAEVERIRNEVKEKQRYPAGHMPLGEEEKEAILKGLNCKKDELMSEMNRLPMRYDTTSVRNRRNALEDQIREVENKIGTFSRKQVYVPCN